MKPTCTHIALFCRDIEASVAFYAQHAGLHEAHRRNDDGTIVVWMGEGQRDGQPASHAANDSGSAANASGDGVSERAQFVLVLLGINPPSGEGPVAHLGYAVNSHDEVDEIARRGRSAGLDVQGPVEAGPIVGYYCLLRDPDGNWVEFSHGQALG